MKLGFVVAAAACVALAGLLPARADTPAPFRLCADPDNLPFSSTGTDTPGFYVELGRDIAQALGQPFQPVWVPTYYTKRQIRLKLLAGQCDAFAGVPDDPSFMGPRLIFSKPVARMGYALVAPPASAVDRPQDLHDKRVAVQFASPPQTLLAAQDNTQMVTVMSPEEAMQDLADGKADAAFIWGPSAGWLNSTTLRGAYRVVPFSDDTMSWQTALAFPRDRTGLRDQVDHALGELSPAIAALAAKYHFPTAEGTPAAAQDAQTQPVNAAPSPATPPAPAPDPAYVAAGRALFNQTCSHCHGPDAVQGEQRRNLRLLTQRYGDQMPEMFMTTVTHGRVSKGMPNWSGILTDDEFHKILAFLKSVQEPAS